MAGLLGIVIVVKIQYRNIVNQSGKKRKVLRPKDEWIPVEVPAIIDKELWDQAQKRRAGLAAKRNYKRHVYLLSGFVRCNRCNSPMHSVMSTGRPTRYYRCSASNNKSILTTCDLRTYFRADWTEKAIWNKLTEIFNDDKQLNAGLAIYQEQIADSLKLIKDELNLVQATISDLDKNLNELFQDFKEARGERYRAQITLDIERVENQLNSLEEQQRKLQGEVEVADLSEQDIITLKAYTLGIRQDWDVISHDLESQRLLLERLALRVTLDKDDPGQKIALLKIKLSNKESVVIGAGTS